MNDDRRGDPSVPDETFTYEDEDRVPPPPPAGEAPESRYVVGEEHARGGIGRILRARDLKLGRDVAIKELISSSARAQARFDREARITARLEHPAIVPVHDAGRWTDNGRPYLAMKLVSGRSLRDAIADARTLRERLSLLPSVITVAEAIGYAHSVGVVHRDLKPSNVLVGDYGETVVIDWGLAKELDRPGNEDDVLDASPYRVVDDEVTVAGSVVGTPAFMSPEQARGLGADQRSDVYALGAVLYSLLAGRAPYEGSSEDIVAMVREGPPAPLSEGAGRVPPDLAAIVSKAMARDPSDRYRDGAALAEDLRKYRTGQLVGAHDYSWPQLVSRWARRNRALAIALALFVMAAAIGSGWFFRREQGLRKDAERARDRSELDRSRAERERDRADQQTVALLEQQGRIELAAGKPFRASLYLSEALRRDPGALAPRWLVSDALRAMHTKQGDLAGYDRDVVGVAVSPDGLRVVTGGTDATARVWDASTRRELRRVQHSGPIESVAYSPNGDLVASGDDSETLLWDPRTGEVAQRLKIGGYRLAFSPTGDLLASGAKDGEVVVLDPATGAIVKRWAPSTGRITDVAWFRDGKRLVTGDFDNKFEVWDAKTARLLRRRADLGEPPCSFDVSDAGDRLLVTTCHEEFYVFDARTGALVSHERLADGTQIVEGEFAPDARTFVVGSIDGTVEVIHSVSGERLAAFDSMARGRLNGISLSADGERLATVGVGGQASLWRLDGLAFRVRAGDEGPDAGYVEACDVVDGGRRFAVTDYGGGTSVRDTETDRVIYTASLGTSPVYAAFDTSGERAVPASERVPQPPVAIWSLEERRELARLEGHGDRVYHVERSADGTMVATAGRDGTARVWSMATGAQLGPAVHSRDHRRFSAVSFSPDAGRIATGDEDGLLQVWERASGKELLAVEAHPSWIQDIEFSPDGARIATGGRLDLMARVWDATSGERLLSVNAQRGNVMVVRFSPDGEVLATSGTDDVANLRDSQTGSLLRTIRGPRHCLAFRPQGTMLETGGPKSYIVSWDYSIDDRPPEEIQAEVRRLSPWRLEGGRLVLPDAD